MRKIVSFSCLLLCASFWTTAVRAQQNPPVSAPAVTGVELPAPADTVVKDQPLATSPPVSFKVDLTGASIPAPNSDQEAVARALKQYDDSMRQWTLPPETMNGIVADSSKFGAPQQNFRLHRNDDYYPRTAREMEWNRQRFEDRIADSIFPGFGRVETTYANGATSRLDYIYTHRCGGRGGLGICWQYRY